MTRAIKNRLVKVEAIKIESHGRNTHSSKPDPITGQADRIKCRELELLRKAKWTTTDRMRM